MRLRHRLLLLIGTLLLAVLAGSLWIVYRDVRTEIRRRVDDGLSVSLAAWRSTEQRSFRVLEVLAWSLESEPGFRNVLRKTDYATLLDHVTRASEQFEVDLVVLADYEGRCRLRSDRPQDPGGDLASLPGVATACDGYAAADYWNLDTGVYQVVVVPLVGAGDLVEGALGLGYRITPDLASRMASDTRTEVLFLEGDTVLASSMDDAMAREAARGIAPEQAGQWPVPEDPKAPDRSVRADLDLGGAEYRTLLSPLRDQAGRPAAWLALLQDTRGALAFLDDTRLRLGLLGLLALGVALAASLPLVGRIANPVEALEKAEAEMKAVFRSTLEGLVALDSRGRVVLANPSAAMALGVPSEDLPGRLLEDLLPADVAAELLGDAPDLVYRAEMRREGHRFQLVRTHVSRTGGQEVGSLVVVRDVTRERRERRDSSRLEGLARILAEAASPEEAHRLGAVLELAARLEAGEFRPRAERLDPGDTAARVAGRGPGLALEVDRAPAVEADPEVLDLALETLVREVARSAPADREVHLSVRRDGGAARLSAWWGEPPEEAKAAEAAEGFLLDVVRRAVELQRGRLRSARGDRGVRLEVWLPAAPQPEEGSSPA